MILGHGTLNGSVSSMAAVRAVAERRWMPGSEVRVLVVRYPVKVSPTYRPIPPLDNLVDDVDEAERAHAEQLAEQAAESLRESFDDSDQPSHLGWQEIRLLK